MSPRKHIYIEYMSEPSSHSFIHPCRDTDVINTKLEQRDVDRLADNLEERLRSLHFQFQILWSEIIHFGCFLARYGSFQ